MIRAYDDWGNELKIKTFNKVEYELKTRADERRKTIDEYTKTLHELMCNENCGNRRCVDDMDKCIWYGYVWEVDKQMKGGAE